MVNPLAAMQEYKMSSNPRVSGGECGCFRVMGVLRNVKHIYLLLDLRQTSVILSNRSYRGEEIGGARAASLQHKLLSSDISSSVASGFVQSVCDGQSCGPQLENTARVRINVAGQGFTFMKAPP